MADITTVTVDGVTYSIKDSGVATAINTALNRSTSVNVANTNYTTLMARGESLNSADTTPTINGAICWTYG